MKYGNLLKNIVRISISMMLAASLVFEIALPVSLGGSNKAEAAWDGYAGEDEEIKIYSLFDFTNLNSFISMGAEPSEQYAEGIGAYSIEWKNQETNTKLWFTQYPSGVPTDWSACKAVKMKIYSAKATNAQIALAIHSSRNALSQIRYYRDTITVNWEGWKEFTFVFSDMEPNRNPDIKDMTGGIELVAHGGYSMTANPETELWISSIELIGGGNLYNFTEAFYEPEEIITATAALKDSVAVYADGANAVTDEGSVPLEYTIDYVDKTVMIPTMVFGDFLGAQICGKDGSYSIKHGDMTVWGKLGEKQVNVDSSEISSQAKELSIAPYEKDDLIYVPAEEVAELLSIPAFSDGRLFCMGSEEMVNQLRRPANLGVNEFNEIVAQLAYAKKIDLEAFTPEDAKQAKDKWRNIIVGNEKVNDMSDPNISAQIKTIERNADAARALLVKQNVGACVFSGLAMTSTANLTSAYDYVLKMAKGYACYGSKYYQDEELLEDIIYALDWLGKNYFSKDGRAAWTMTGLDNWWDWYIGVPYNLVQTLICIEDQLKAKQIENYLDYYYNNLAFPYDSAANMADTCLNVMGAALLQNDYKKVVEMNASIMETYLYVDDNERVLQDRGAVVRDGKEIAKGTGFFTDGSYIFHLLHPMTGQYGYEHFGALLEYEAVISGTPLDINNSLKYNLPEFYLNNMDSINYGSAIFPSVRGRFTPEDSSKYAISFLGDVFVVAENYDDATRDEMYAIIKDTYLDTPYKEEFINGLPINYVAKFKEMIADDSIKSREEVKMSKTFHNMDRVIHKRDDWAAGVAMSSSRIFNYQSINSQNLTGWYQGDGRTEWLIKDTDTNLSKVYWESIDPYRLPGTTVDTQERQAATVYLGNEYLSSKDFVGGVSLNNEYSIAAMDLESQHFDADFAPAGGNAHGGANPAHKNDLTAKKSYFMTDDAVVCLGTDVNATDNNNAEVLTIVENVLSTSVQNFTENSVSMPAYEIKAVDGTVEEEANVPANTIDGSYSTKWAGVEDQYVIWDIGEVNTLGFINLAFASGNTRAQKFELQVSSNGKTFETVFKGSSSGTTEDHEAFNLNSVQGRYVKFINHGNSKGSQWVSITEASIYPPNTDGTIGILVDDIYGANPLYTENGEAEIYGDDVELEDISWANYDDLCGYWFPQDNKTEQLGSLKARRTNGKTSHLEIWYSHGVNPEKGGYAYALLPGATAEETKAFAESGNVEILSNNGKIQAVRDKRTNVTYIVFWQPGEFEGITMENPGMVIVRETEDKYEISISDPTQLLTSTTVKINKALTAVDLDESAKAVSEGETTTITLEMTVSPGRSYECIFKK